MIALDPVVSDVRRVTDDSRVGGARKIRGRRLQEIALVAVGLDQLLAAPNDVDATRIDLDSVNPLPRGRPIQFRKDAHRCFEKGATPIAWVKYRPAPVGQGPSHHHGRQVIGSVVDPEEAPSTDVGPVLRLAR